MTFSGGKRTSYVGLMVLGYAAFASLGLPDGLLGVAWPTLRADFGIPLDALGMLLVAYTAGYLISSFSSGRLVPAFGVGRVLVASCALTGAALIGYTLAPAWWAVVAFGAMAGLGAGAIDAGLNTFVAAHFGHGLMQWLHASYGIGITLGPLIMTFGLSMYANWRPGYVVVGLMQLGLATAFLLTLPLWKAGDNDSDAEKPVRLTDFRTPTMDTLRQPFVWMSLAMFFIYTGSEVMLGAWAYSLLTESRGVAAKSAGLWTGSYWAMFTIGRVIAGLFASRTDLHALVKACMVTAVGGSLLLCWNPFGSASLCAFVIIGFAIAPIYPGMVSGTSQRVDPRHAANTIGMQVGAAAIGAAIMPALAGVLARHTSLEAIPICLAIAMSLLLTLHFLSMWKKHDTSDA